MAEALTKPAARNVFYEGSFFSFAIFVGLTDHSRWYMVNPSTGARALTDPVARGKHVWEGNACINCHTILGEGACFATGLCTVWDCWGGREDPDAARETLKAWMAADAAAQPDRPGIERPRRLPALDRHHQDPELAAQHVRPSQSCCPSSSRSASSPCR